MPSNSKVGVYVDVENIKRSGGYGMLYDVLRKFACRDGAEPIRLNAYVGFDRRRAERDRRYERNVRNFFSTIRDYGYKVIEKEVKWYVDEDGVEFAKANADLDMAVDALLQSENLDRVLLVTGDGDFVQVVRALQNKGCRVEVVGFDHVSVALKQETDMFTSGYLIPNLLPIHQTDPGVSWGDINSRVRGTCYYYRQGEHYGFMRYLKHINRLWITDPREPESPYQTIYCNPSAFEDFDKFDLLPSRSIAFEFKLAESTRVPGQLQAEEIVVVSG
ncbi:MAG: NYN domain-containing protein [Deltaproteobacteria bacterium]|nr:MAG: NYN domain-containing protein [Deltaproteobacteria bacterium]